MLYKIKPNIVINIFGIEWYNKRVENINSHINRIEIYFGNGKSISFTMTDKELEYFEKIMSDNLGQITPYDMSKDPDYNKLQS